MKGNYKAYLQGETVKLKKYFYVLRPLLACRWILKKGCPPPMLFSESKQACLAPALMPTVDCLLARKATTSELGEGTRIDELHRYVEESFSELETLLKAYSPTDIHGWEELNTVFSELLG